MFEMPYLHVVRRIPVPGIACQAAFVQSGLVVLCAVEEGDVHTILGYIGGNRTIVDEILSMPGLPGALEVLPDGTVLASSDGMLARVSLPSRKAVWQSYSFLLPGVLSVRGEDVLVSDSLKGRVVHIAWRRPREQHLIYQGGEPAAVWQE